MSADFSETGACSDQVAGETPDQLPADETLIREEGQPDEPELPSGKAGYWSLDLSVTNFKTGGILDAEATAYGLVFVGGYRFGEFFSLEGALNWLPLADYTFLLPIPMQWLPAENGVYLNLAGGMRLNLVEDSSHNTVPWVSLWYTGHALLGDFEVAGVGFTYGAGIEWKKKNGKKGRLALRLHTFDGDLEIKERNFNIEYGPTDIRAIELSFTLFGN